MFQCSVLSTFSGQLQWSKYIMWGALREMTEKMSGCGWLCAPRTKNIKRKTKCVVWGEANKRKILTHMFLAYCTFQLLNPSSSAHCGKSTLCWDRPAGGAAGNRKETFWSSPTGDGTRQSCRKTRASCRFFQKCCGIFADFLQNKEFLLFFCLVSLVGTRTQNCSLPEGFPSLLPPSQLHKSNLSAGTTLLRTYHHPHSSLYKPRTRVTGFLFWILVLWRWDR